MQNFENEALRQVAIEQLVDFGLSLEEATIFVDTDKTIIETVLRKATSDLSNDKFLYTEQPSLAQMVHSVKENIKEVIRQTEGMVNFDGLIYHNLAHSIYAAYLKGREDEKLSVWESNDVED